ncbi:cell wall-binding repeat-containing protein [Metabacillus indicus]|uniref:cell wall-binding repeat-containing protein n=1 Tax=Metabacillus indicus TaxID=246786 RepID=UPI002A005C0C|nr:cell wall-binding repeat-containing protein [Metabacillus indicus]MDX8290947.1 cell wall-binding repeat-containing protein [Metabacillus indicus]
MKKELLLACGLMLALPGVQGFAAEKTTEKWSAAQVQAGQMKAFGFDEEEGMYYEEEPNNDLLKANPVETGYSIFGKTVNQASNNGNDLDYYKFTVGSEAHYNLLGFTENGKESTLKIRLLSSDGKEAAKSTFYDEDEGLSFQSIEAQIPAGTYYLEVSNSSAASLNEPYYLLHDAMEKLQRISGKDRYETAVNISKENWFEGDTDTAVLATGTSFPDALSATPLAYSENAPLLLTRPAALPGVVKNELTRLDVTKVIIVGGTGAVSADVEKELKGMGLRVSRISGSDRYVTSAKIAEKIGTYGPVTLATGLNFADALSIAPIAAQMEMPILLTRKDSVPGAVNTFMKNWEVDETYIIGGSSVISDASVKALPGKKRISGKDRYATNSKIIETFMDKDDVSMMFFATGANYPDALAGSALAANYFSPVVLVNPAKFNSSTYQTVQTYKEQTFINYILGGETALPQKAIDQLFE